MAMYGRMYGVAIGAALVLSTSAELNARLRSPIPIHHQRRSKLPGRAG